MEADSVKCQICNTNIFAKCYDIHKRACLKKQQKNSMKSTKKVEMVDMIPCSECGQMVPFVVYAIHEQQCVGRQLSKCTQCKLLYPSFLIQEHMNVCDTFNEEPQMQVPIKVQSKPSIQQEIGDEFQDYQQEEEQDIQMDAMIMNLARNAPQSDQPLTLSQIQKLPQVLASKPQDCSICYMKVFPRTMIVRLPCPHLYHTKCISAWLQKNPQCPMCRKHALAYK